MQLHKKVLTQVKIEKLLKIFQVIYVKGEEREVLSYHDLPFVGKILSHLERDIQDGENYWNSRIFVFVLKYINIYIEDSCLIRNKRDNVSFYWKQILIKTRHLSVLKYSNERNHDLPPFFHIATQLLAEVLPAISNIRIFVTVNNIRRQQS